MRMIGMRRIGAMGALISVVVIGAPGARAQPVAGEVFGAMTTATGGPAEAIGGYGEGCVAGAERLAADGDGWLAMRLQRNRHWGHPALLAFIEQFAADLKAQQLPGLLVGDMAQPRGGPMRTGHVSHQSGLDVDIWYKPPPVEGVDMAARETMSALSLLRPGTRELDDERFAAFATTRVLATAAAQPDVSRIFVHPAIKAGLCGTVAGDRDWLRKVRPWWGHHYHFHVRLHCPADSADCVDQTPPPAGDGCGEALDWWLSDEPWQPRETQPRPPLRLDALPQRCQRLATAP